MKLRDDLPPLPANIIRAKLPPISEKAFSAQVVQLAKTLGWKVYRTWISIHSPAGFPDLVLARQGPDGIEGRIIFAELKSASGILTTAQNEWLALLHACGCVCHIWRPSDLEFIAEILR